MARPLVADIDLKALRHNYRVASELAPTSANMAVIKADAYGHGAANCARALAEAGAPAFGVASLEEAIALRDAGISQPILLLEGIFDAGELARVEMLDLWQVVHSDWQLEALLAYRPARPLTVWLKLDSGMHRLGFTPEAFVVRWERLAAAGTQVATEGLHLISHFASADQARSVQFAAQWSTIEQVRDRLGCRICVANSPATLARPATHAAWNRPGVMLYGSNPLDGALPVGVSLDPVMTLRSRLIAVQTLEADEPVGYGGRFRTAGPSRIGIVAAGYGDGYDRHAVDGTPVLVDGVRAPLAGRVSMDMLTVDISHLPAAKVGSEVVLWGRSSTGSVLSVDEVATHCDTIGYTLLTGVLPRVPRRFLE
ncbi:alanine racemase [Salinicola rhizosphaerae]|uniref:Alanine racemase n=1 Tax=Salinicola rhizosphaerae TaxID=1443141 RepID=A0ABQ3E4C1_9GAMM|nr:alanine racemase [Salinicola rhizosphaerae]GHB25432.1 alanine racemase [Salinicola rhizosphaerae]